VAARTAPAPAGRGGGRTRPGPGHRPAAVRRVPRVGAVRVPAGESRQRRRRAVARRGGHARGPAAAPDPPVGLGPRRGRRSGARREPRPGSAAGALVGLDGRELRRAADRCRAVPTRGGTRPEPHAGAPAPAVRRLRGGRRSAGGCDRRQCRHGRRDGGPRLGGGLAQVLRGRRAGSARHGARGPHRPRSAHRAPVRGGCRAHGRGGGRGGSRVQQRGRELADPCRLPAAAGVPVGGSALRRPRQRLALARRHPRGQRADDGGPGAVQGRGHAHRARRDLAPALPRGRRRHVPDRRGAHERAHRPARARGGPAPPRDLRHPHRAAEPARARRRDRPGPERRGRRPDPRGVAGVRHRPPRSSTTPWATPRATS
jgi:hypothetical protein